MNASTIKKLQSFVGHVCSVISTSINRSFDEQIAREHFVIRIEHVDVDGIWGHHPYNPEMISFFALNHIVSIQKELELNPNNPEHAKILSNLEDSNGDLVINKPKDPLEIIESPVESSTGDSVFVDIQALETLAESTKRSLSVYDLLKK